MKINKYYKQQVLIVSTLLLLLNTSCNDFLNNVAPQGQEASTVFMEEQANAELAVAGMYNMLAFCRGSGPDGDWVDNHFDSYFGSMMSDDSEKGSQPADNPNGLTQLTMYQLTPTLVLNKFFYIHGFWGVSRANFVLDNVIDADFDPAVRDRMLGEAHFFRAYYYYRQPQLSRVRQRQRFGHIPKQMQEHEGQRRRKLADEVEKNKEYGFFHTAIRIEKDY